LGLVPAVKIGNLITSGLEKITKKKYGRETTKELAATKAGKVLGLATTAAAAAAAAAANPAIAARAVGSLVPKSGMGKAAALLVGGAAVTSKTVRKAIVETPSLIFEKGEALGKEAETQVSEGSSGGKTTTAVLLGAAAGLAIPKVLDLIGQGKEKVSAAKETATGILQELPADLKEQLPVIGSAPAEMPITPETEELIKTRRRKHKKKALEPPRQTIRQTVNVQVGVNAGNKKYIRNVCYV